MMPRLQAEEQLAAVRIGGLAAGLYSARDRDQLIGDMERRARGGERQRARKATLADLSGMGIGVAPPKTAVSDV